MSYQIEIDHEGTLQVSKRRIDKLEINARNMRDVLYDVYFYIVSINEKNFDTNGFGDWPPLAESTQRRKARQGLDPRPLRASSRLFASLAGIASPDRIVHVDRDSLYFASTVPYGPPHRDGAGVPQRKPMNISRSRRGHIVRIVRSGLIDAD